MEPFRLIGPLAVWELRRLARRGTAMRARFGLVYLLFLAFIVFAIYTLQPSARDVFTSNSAIRSLRAPSDFAGQFTIVFLAVQLFAVVLMTPAVAASAVAEEKDRQTLPLLLTTALTESEIVFGKAAARIALVLTAVLAGLPVLMFTLFLGRVDVGFVLAGYALTIGTVILCAALGMFAACSAPDLRSALPRAYGSAVLLVCIPLATLLAFAELESSAGLLVVGGLVPLAQVLVGGVVLVSATRLLRLREATAGPRPFTAFPQPPRPADPPLLMPARVRAPRLPPLDQANPVLWKERCAGWRPSWSMPRLAKVLADLTTVLGVLLFLGGAWTVMQRMAKSLDPAEAERLAQQHGGRAPDWGGLFLVGAGMFAAGRYLLPLAVGVSGTIAGERRRGTLDSLLSTTLDRRTILWAKVRAHAERGAGFGVAAATVLGMAFIADAGIRLGLAAVALCASGIGLVIALGAWLTVRCSSDVRAFRLLLPVTVPVIGWPLGVWFLLGPNAAVSHEDVTRGLLAAACACAVVGLVLWWRAGVELERGE